MKHDNDGDGEDNDGDGDKVICNKELDIKKICSTWKKQVKKETKLREEIGIFSFDDRVSRTAGAYKLRYLHGSVGLLESLIIESYRIIKHLLAFRLSRVGWPNGFF